MVIGGQVLVMEKYRSVSGTDFVQLLLLTALVHQ